MKTDSLHSQPALRNSKSQGGADRPVRYALAALIPVASLLGCSNTSDEQRIAQLEEQVAELSADTPDEDGVSRGESDPDLAFEGGGSEPVDLDYAEQYLAWVSPSNCAISRGVEEEAAIVGADGTFYENEWDDIGAELNAVYDKVASALIAALNQASELSWPADVQDNVDSVVAEMAELAALYSGFAHASTFVEWSVAFERASGFTGRTSAALLRTKLGLPSNIGDDSDYC